MTGFQARFTLSWLVTDTTRNPDGATVMGFGAPEVPVPVLVVPVPVPVPVSVLVPVPVLPLPVLPVAGARITWYVPTGGGPNSAIAAPTIDAWSAVSDRFPRYRPSAAAMSVDE